MCKDDTEVILTAEMYTENFTLCSNIYLISQI